MEDKRCLLNEFHKHICTLFSNLAVGFLFAKHRRPTLLFRVVASLPEAFVFQFFKLLIFLRILVELPDANRCQAGNDGKELKPGKATPP